jgi:signal transduction histidine kinase
MRTLFGRLMPRRIATQSAAVVVASVVLIHLAITAQLWLLESRVEVQRREFVPAWHFVRVVTSARQGDERERMIAGLSRAYPSIDLTLSRSPPSGATMTLDPAEHRPPLPLYVEIDSNLVVKELTSETNGFASPATAAGPTGSFVGVGAHRFAVGLPDGDWISFTDRPPPRPQVLFGPWGTTVIFVALSSILLGLWAVRGLVGPLKAFAAAAREFDIEGEPAPLPRHGPEEVRVAASAFEAMRLRIRGLVEDRTRMLAAMGHDLRTPLTRLRLRSEFVGDDAIKAEIQRDLAAMNGMIEGALTYLTEGRHREAIGLVDLSATLQTICDGWNDLGRDVTFEGPDHLVRRVRPIAIERAFANLVDNALKFGNRCTIRLEALKGAVVVEVEDDGPGIAEADREGMLRPFVRGDVARNMDEARGFGLGLAVVKAVVDGHDGRLDLESATPHGLLVRITLPVVGEA